MTNAGFPKYESYRDSGVEWLGSVPRSWALTRLGGLFDERKSKVSDNDFKPLSVTKNGILPQLDNAAKTNDGDNRKLVKAGDFVINSRSDRKGSSGVSPLDGSVSMINIVLKPTGILPEFCNHILKSRAFVEEYYRMGHGIVADLWTTRYDEMRAIVMALPSPEEQRAIAAFLDEKSAKLDEAVRIKEAQIVLLRERRQILIQHAVTRGLNPDAPMKDSGIDWIGQIPAHWDVKRLKHISTIRYGLGQPPKESDDGLPLLRATNVDRGKINPANLIRVDPADVPTGRDAFLTAGEIIVVRSGAYTGDSAIILSEYAGSVAGYDMVVSAFGVDCHFLALAFLCPYVLFEQLYLLRMRAAQPHLNKEELGETVILVPPRQEQLLIAERMRIESNKIDKTISVKQDQIAALKEYKTSLINAVVTGKIKVA